MKHRNISQKTTYYEYKQHTYTSSIKKQPYQLRGNLGPSWHPSLIT